MHDDASQHENEDASHEAHDEEVLDIRIPHGKCVAYGFGLSLNLAVKTPIERNSCILHHKVVFHAYVSGA